MISKEFLENDGWVYEPDNHDRKFHGGCTNEKYPDWHIVGTPGHPDGQIFVNYVTDSVEFVETEEQYLNLFN